MVERDRYERRFVAVVKAVGLAKGGEERLARVMLLGALNWTPTWYRRDGEPPRRIAQAYVRMLRESMGPGTSIKDQSIEIYEVRSHWKDASRKIERPIAKATYNKSARNWKVFWQRADLKWHGYEPHLTVPSIEAFLDVVDKDEHACFFG